MRFRRNVKDEKLFRWIAIGGLVLIAILLIVFFITKDVDLIELITYALFIPPIFCLMSCLLKKSFVEFNDNQIILINGHGRDFNINLSDVTIILIPSPEALKRKFRDNPIIIVRQDFKNIITYSKEIENYIKDNLKVDISYYDNYRQAIK
ncbi:MAG: hypothetical protein IJ039_05700 [Clostridia bacterium]|nr:hypothetical protein [Clostridia bacterium]